MTALQEYDARLALRPRPAKRLPALWIRGRHQRSHVRADAEAPIDFIVDDEVLQSRGNRMIAGDDDDRHINVVLIADLLGHHARLVRVWFRITPADDALVFRPLLIRDERVMEHDQAD